MSDKVLVVDDSGTMRKIVIRALNSVGYTDIVEAADGVEGLAAFKEHAFQLVLTDWNMPNKTGLELTRDIRATGSKIPIFMITTEGEKSRVLEAIGAGGYKLFDEAVYDRGPARQAFDVRRRVSVSQRLTQSASHAHKFVDPFVSSACSVFKTMLGCTLTQGQASEKVDRRPTYEVSGLIGLGGRFQGMVVVSVGRETAIKAADIMLETNSSELNDEVLDAFGELTNMIVGGAKTELETYQLSIGLPTVICGKSQSVRFPVVAAPILIPFESKIGPLCVEVGLIDMEHAAHGDDQMA